MSRLPSPHHFSHVSAVDGHSYYMNTLTYTTDTNINAFQPAYPCPAEQAPKKEAPVTMRTYQVEFNSSRPNEIVEGVTQLLNDENQVIFYGDGQVILRAFPVASIFAYGLVADPEKVVTPKYLFRLRLVDDSTVEVKADLYAITKSGDEGTSVYEFFTALDKNGTKTRSELAIPYMAVRLVERVDPEKATAAVSEPRTGSNLMDTEDYGDASPKR